MSLARLRNRDGKFERSTCQGIVYCMLMVLKMFELYSSILMREVNGMCHVEGM